MTITYRMADRMGYVIIYPVGNPARSIYVQTDWEYPGIAQTFGWRIADVGSLGNMCDHYGTDGTIRCYECGLEPSDFIHAAHEWLDANEGTEVEDPGYFHE